MGRPSLHRGMVFGLPLQSSQGPWPVPDPPEDEMDPRLLESIKKNWPVGADGWVRFPPGAFAIMPQTGMVYYAQSQSSDFAREGVLVPVSDDLQSAMFTLGGRATAFGFGPFRIDGLRFRYQMTSDGEESEDPFLWGWADLYDAAPDGTAERRVAVFGTVLPDDILDPPWMTTATPTDPGESREVTIPVNPANPDLSFDGPYSFLLRLTFGYGNSPEHNHTFVITEVSVHLVQA